MNIENQAYTTKILYGRSLEDALNKLKKVINECPDDTNIIESNIIIYESRVIEIKDKFGLEVADEFPQINEEYKKLFPQIEQSVLKVRGIFSKYS